MRAAKSRAYADGIREPDRDVPRDTRPSARLLGKISGSGWPQKVNLDGSAPSHLGLRLPGEEDSRWQSVKVRVRHYLNNIVEQGSSDTFRSHEGTRSEIARAQSDKVPDRRNLVTISDSQHANQFFRRRWISFHNVSFETTSASS